MCWDLRPTGISRYFDVVTNEAQDSYIVDFHVVGVAECRSAIGLYFRTLFVG